MRVRYQTLEFKNVDIHIKTLRDNQEFNDPLGEAEALGISSAQWSLFGVLWDSGKVLALVMEDYDIEGFELSPLEEPESPEVEKLEEPKPQFTVLSSSDEDGKKPESTGNDKKRNHLSIVK